MSQELPFISIVLPAHNEEQYIGECLSALCDQDYPKARYEILVVDNNSTDSTAVIANRYGATVLHEQTGPVGRVRNTGAKAARGDLILFLDSDCVAPRNWVSYAAGRLSGSTELVLGGGYELRSVPRPLEKYWLLDGKKGATLPKDLLGGCIGLSREAFIQCGGFDETLTSGEDTKLSESLRQQGFKVVIDRGMSVVHLGNPTQMGIFFRRQIWHSENYIHDIGTSLKDPTFYLIASFMIAVWFSLMLAVVTPKLALLLLLLALAIPLIFSIKRIARSRNPAHLKKLHRIYLVDLTYVSGRSMGILKGMKNVLKNVGSAAS